SRAARSGPTTKGGRSAPFSKEERHMAFVVNRTSGQSLRPANRRRAGIALLAFVWLLAGATGLFAQNTVTLSGRVTAADGTPLSGVQITVLNTETAQERGALTTAEGTYAIVGLPPG